MLFHSATLSLLLSSLSLGHALPAPAAGDLAPLDRRSTAGIHLYGCGFLSGASFHTVAYFVGYCANDNDCSNTNYYLPSSDACSLGYSNYDSKTDPTGYPWEGAAYPMVPHSCTFSTGVTFSWNLVSDARSKPNYTLVGTGTNGQTFNAYKDDWTKGPKVYYADTNWQCYREYYFIPQ